MSHRPPTRGRRRKGGFFAVGHLKFLDDIVVRLTAFREVRSNILLQIPSDVSVSGPMLIGWGASRQRPQRSTEPCPRPPHPFNHPLLVPEPRRDFFTPARMLGRGSNAIHAHTDHIIDLGLRFELEEGSLARAAQNGGSFRGRQKHSR